MHTNTTLILLLSYIMTFLGFHLFKKGLRRKHFDQRRYSALGVASILVSILLFFVGYGNLHYMIASNEIELKFGNSTILGFILGALWICSGTYGWIKHLASHTKRTITLEIISLFSLWLILQDERIDVRDLFLTTGLALFLILQIVGRRKFERSQKSSSYQPT